MMMSWADKKRSKRWLRRKGGDHIYKNPDSGGGISANHHHQTLYSEATVLRLGPTFMSIYIPNLAIERPIYYGEVEGLTVEWLGATSTLLLGWSMHEHPPNRQTQPARISPLEDVATLVSPVIITDRNDDAGGLCGGNLEPLFFPITLHLKSRVPVALHTISGGDIVARLFVTSYFQ